MEYNSITCGIGCRSCFQRDSMRTSYTINGSTEEELKSLSEYKMMKMIENWRKDDNIVCDNCSSPNMEVDSIEVNNYKLYDYNRIYKECALNKQNIIQIEMFKKNSYVEMQPKGNPNPGKDFLLNAITFISQTLNQLSDDYFEGHDNAHFIICAKEKVGASQSYISIETLSHAGFKKEEILDMFKRISLT